jgi:hypothetical protein
MATGMVTATATAMATATALAMAYDGNGDGTTTAVATRTAMVMAMAKPTQCVERPGKRHRVVWQQDDVGLDDEWRAGVVELNGPPQHVARDDRVPR